MFNPMKDVESSQKKDPVPTSDSRDIPAKNKKKEDPTPSQVGSFLQALDRSKEEKKRINPQLASLEDDADDGSLDTSKESSGLFGLIPKKNSEKPNTVDHPLDSNLMALTQVPTQVPIQVPTQVPISSETSSSKNSDSNKIPLSPTTLPSSLLTPSVEPHTEKSTFSMVNANDTSTKDESEVAAESSQLMINSNDKPLLSLTTKSVLQETGFARDSANVRRSEMIQLIDALAQHITTLKSENLTSTQILLKNPPIFEGATLVINEYSTSKNEFNIVFSNLSPDARKLIESQENQRLIETKLIDQGYTIRTITIDSGLRFSDTGSQQSSSSSSDNSRSKEKDSQSNKRNKDWVF